MRAPSRTSSTLQRQAFFCYFSGHTYFNLQENSASIQRERARARDRAREREREREKASPIVYFHAEPCCACVCVCVCVLGQPALFLHFEKKNPKFFWLVGCLRIPPRLFSSSSSASLPHIYTLHKKCIYWETRASVFFSFSTIYPGLVG